MLRRRRLRCRQIVELVTEYLDGAMVPARRARFEAHLAGCDGCSAYLEQMRATVGLLERIDGDSVPAPVMRQLLSAFREWCDDRPPTGGVGDVVDGGRA